MQTVSPAYYNEDHRPQFHFSPAANWTNDPNGLVYFDGEYHLFYQYNPDGSFHANMHWGHAVSPDLIHWTHLPVALAPDHIGQIWSGSAVVDATNTSGLVPGGGIIAIFSYHDQSQGIAYSRDRGRTFSKYEGNPVIPVGGKDFRDPKVFWHEQRARWILILAASDRARIYSSPNLIDWTFESDFGSAEGAHTGVWECPDLFELPIGNTNKWVMTISLDGAPAGGRGTQYFIGQFDGKHFVNDNPPAEVLWMDYGPDNYAGVTFSNAPDEKPVFLGWMSDWRYARSVPTEIWRGAMTIPRTLALKTLPEGIRLLQWPVASVERLRETPVTWANQTITPDDPSIIDLNGKSFEIEATVEPGSTAQFGFRVLWNGDQETIIGYDIVGERLFVDRQRAGLSAFHPEFAAHFSAPLRLENGQVTIRALVDWSSVEVFGNGGEATITAQVFPDRASDQVAFYSTGDVRIVSLSIYPIKRIWPESAPEAAGQPGKG